MTPNLPKTETLLPKLKFQILLPIFQIIYSLTPPRREFVLKVLDVPSERWNEFFEILKLQEKAILQTNLPDSTKHLILDGAVRNVLIIKLETLPELINESVAYFEYLISKNNTAEIKHQIADSQMLFCTFRKTLEAKLKTGNYTTYNEYKNLIQEVTYLTMNELDGVSGLKNRKAFCNSLEQENQERIDFLKANPEKDYISLYRNYPLDSSNMGVANEEGQHRGDKTIAEIGKANAHIRDAVMKANLEVESMEGYRIGGDEFMPRVRFKTREVAQKSMYFGIANQFTDEFNINTATKEQKAQRRAEVLISDMNWFNKVTFEAAKKESTLTVLSQTMISKMSAMTNSIFTSFGNWKNYVDKSNWLKQEKDQATENLEASQKLYENFRSQFADNFSVINTLREFGGETKFQQTAFNDRETPPPSQENMARIGDWDILKPLFKDQVPNELLGIKNTLDTLSADFGEFPFAFTLTSGYATHDQISQIISKLGTSELPVPDFLQEIPLEFKGTGTADTLSKIILTSTPKDIFWLLIYKDISKLKIDGKRVDDKIS